MYPEELFHPLQQASGWSSHNVNLATQQQFRLIASGWVDDLPGVLHGQQNKART